MVDRRIADCSACDPDFSDGVRKEFTAVGLASWPAKRLAMAMRRWLAPVGAGPSDSMRMSFIAWGPL